MEIGLEIEKIEFILNKNPFYFGMYFGFPQDKSTAKLSYAILDNIVVEELDQEYTLYTLNFYDIHTYEFLGSNTFMKGIMEHQIEKGSWRKIIFSDDIEEAKVLMVAK